MTAGREHVAIFNPLVLPLPSWHPNGPDGAIDGFVIPFVHPAGGGEPENRKCRVVVTPDEVTGQWSAKLRNHYAWRAATAEQARALAAAWIRAAEVLANVGANDGVVDAEVVEDDEDQAESEESPLKPHDCEYDDPRMCRWPGHRQ